MKGWLKTFDRNDLMYFCGLAMLFIGLSLAVSIATALVVVGTAMSLVSVFASFFVTSLSARGPHK